MKGEILNFSNKTYLQHLYEGNCLKAMSTCVRFHNCKSKIRGFGWYGWISFFVKYSQSSISPAENGMKPSWRTSSVPSAFKNLAGLKVSGSVQTFGSWCTDLQYGRKKGKGKLRTCGWNVFARPYHKKQKKRHRRIKKLTVKRWKLPFTPSAYQMFTHTSVPFGILWSKMVESV